jgi:uncharacterized protein (TIGR03435 family)
MFLMRFGLTVVLMSCSLPSIAQTLNPLSSATRKFAVASVRTSKIGEMSGETSRRESIEPSPGSLTMRNVSLKSCVIWAYRIKDYQLSGPSWLTDERYDIAAKSPDPVPVEQLKEMMQTLLAERFALQFHRQTKELSIYALVAGANGPKLHKVAAGGDSEMRMKDGSLIFNNTSMPQFADHLEIMRRQVDRPVVDRTGLTGVFDFSLKFADTDTDMRTAMVQGDSASVFNLIQQQIGLKLEAKKGPVEIIVIDYVNKIPTAN